MNIGSIFLLIAILIVIGFLILRPFYTPQKENIMQSGTAAQHTYSSLLAEKERLLNAIQEMEFDHDTGKIPDDIFPEQRLALMREAAVVIEKISQINPALLHLSSDSSTASAAQKPYDDLEEMIAKRRLTLNQKSTGFCPQCGHAVMASDRFCPKCGSTIRIE
jgi:NADH pyrophosphatase NudC (nudix superfamily)